jgi:hypothetical protein
MDQEANLKWEELIFDQAKLVPFHLVWPLAMARVSHSGGSLRGALAWACEEIVMALREPHEIRMKRTRTGEARPSARGRVYVTKDTVRNFLFSVDGNVHVYDEERQGEDLD